LRSVLDVREESHREDERCERGRGLQKKFIFCSDPFSGSVLTVSAPPEYGINKD
jgi:hypothetical protein